MHQPLAPFRALPPSLNSSPGTTTASLSVSYAPNHRRPARTYDDLDEAYEFFNRELFLGTLPSCLITVTRTRKAYGYFAPERFVNTKDADEIADEIALNPAHFASQGHVEVLGTLGHGMAHLWQHHFGKPSRGGYHNREWARKMFEIGLIPSATGEPGGKPTGERVSHYIREDGRFEQACAKFLACHTTALFQDRAYSERAGTEGAVRDRLRKAASKTLYLCPGCGLHAWAKPHARLHCEDCDEHMQA